jgi:hypothetical protein
MPPAKCAAITHSLCAEVAAASTTSGTQVPTAETAQRAGRGSTRMLLGARRARAALNADSPAASIAKSRWCAKHFTVQPLSVLIYTNWIRVITTPSQTVTSVGPATCVTDPPGSSGGPLELEGISPHPPADFYLLWHLSFFRGAYRDLPHSGSKVGASSKAKVRSQNRLMTIKKRSRESCMLSEPEVGGNGGM